MELLLEPFHKKFTIGKDLIISGEVDNPYNPMDKVDQITTFNLTSIDQNGKAIITKHIDIDLESFKEKMKASILEMTKLFERSDSSLNEINEVEFDMDIKNRKTIEYDVNSTWSTQIVTSAIITTVDPKNGKKIKDIEETISFK